MFLLCLLVLCSFNIREAKAETNLLKNGDFSEGLNHWEVLVWPVGDAPHVGVSEVSPGNPCLFMDVPIESAALVYQVFDLPPAEKAVLSFKVFGGRDPVDAFVSLDFLNGSYVDLEEFDPMGKRSYGGVPTYKIYDITRYCGQTLALCFYATSPFTISPSLCVDDVRVAVVTGRNSIITCSSHPVQIGFGEKITINGSIFTSPPYPSNVTVTLTFTPPIGSPITENVTSDISGEYIFDQLEPNMTGIWKVNASWPGIDDKYDPAVSCYSQFMITATSGIFLSRCVINGLEVDLENPYVEALPAESLSGFLELETRGAGRHENAPVIAISTIENSHWDLLAFHQGVVRDYYGTGLDPFGPKTVFTPPELITYMSPSPLEGVFIHPFRWEFPVPVDTPNDLVGGGEPAVVAWHPTYIAPRLAPNEENATFYVVIIQSAQLQGRDIAFPPSHQFIDRTVDSLWDLNNTDWERFVPGKRNETDSTEACIIAIPITVVADPTPLMQKAQEVIDKINRNIFAFPKLTQALETATQWLNNATSEFGQRRFSDARRSAKQAYDLAQAAKRNMTVVTEEIIKEANSTKKELENYWKNYTDLSDLDDLIDSAWDQFRAENFAKAKQVIEDFEEEVDGYSLPTTHPAYETIGELDRNRWGFPELEDKIRQAEGNLTAAEREFILGNYSVAIELADKANDVAENVLITMQNTTENAIRGAENVIFSLEENFGNYTDVSYLKDLTDSAWDEFRASDFAEAKRLVERFKETARDYSFPSAHPVNGIIQELRRNRGGFPELEGEIREAEETLSAAEGEFIAENFSGARKLADQSFTMANTIYIEIENMTVQMKNRANEKRSSLEHYWWFADLTYLDDLINEIEIEQKAREYAKARILIGNFYGLTNQLERARVVWMAMFIAGVVVLIIYTLLVWIEKTNKTYEEARAYILRLIFALSTASVLHLVFHAINWTPYLVGLTILPYFLMSIIIPCLQWYKKSRKEDREKNTTSSDQK